MSATTQPYKYGRLPAMRPAALSDLSVYTTGKLPAPPKDVQVPAGTYPMDGNDKYGDCTIAGVAHLIEAWNSVYGKALTVPGEKQVIDEFLKLNGGQADVGLSEAQVLSLWHKSGLFGDKIAAYAPVSDRDTLGIHQAIAEYGGCYLGIQCPESAQEQFQNDQPWTYVPGSPVEGHCIVGLGYNEKYVECATWGGIAKVTYPFLAHYLEEVWVIISQQLVEAKQNNLGVDLKALQEDLEKV
jgi:hypothetical protein